MHPPPSNSPSRAAVRRSKRPSRKPDEWWASKKISSPHVSPRRALPKRLRSPVADEPRKRRAHEGVLELNVGESAFGEAGPQTVSSTATAAQSGVYGHEAGPAGGAGTAGDKGAMQKRLVADGDGDGAAGAVGAAGAAGAHGAHGADVAHGADGAHGVDDVDGVENRLRAASFNHQPSPVTPWDSGGAGRASGSVVEERSRGDEGGGIDTHRVVCEGKSCVASACADIQGSGGSTNECGGLNREAPDNGGIVGLTQKRSKATTSAGSHCCVDNGSGARLAASEEDGGGGAMNVEPPQVDEISHDRSDVDMAATHPGATGLGGSARVSFARSSDLRFENVQGVDGEVSVAIALSMNNSYTGLVEVPPHTNTGAQRALKGDEFFLVDSGHVYMDVGDMRHALQAGDHVAVPHMACYAFHNRAASPCRLVFFVPRNPFG